MYACMLNYSGFSLYFFSTISLYAKRICGCIVLGLYFLLEFASDLNRLEFNDGSNKAKRYLRSKLQANRAMNKIFPNKSPWGAFQKGRSPHIDLGTEKKIQKLDSIPVPLPKRNNNSAVNLGKKQHLY